MTMTTLDPACALIAIDLQKALVDMPLAHPFGEVLSRSVELLDAFRAAGAPVVLVNADDVPPGRTEQGRPSFAFPEGWADLVPELDAQASDLRVTKRSWGAFIGTPLRDALARRGVTQVVIVGVATSLGVESTAREAYALGFNVTLAVDAMTDLTLEAHRNTIERVFPRLGERGTAREIAEALAAGRV